MFYTVVERAKFGDLVSARLDHRMIHSGQGLPRGEFRRLGPQQCVAIFSRNPQLSTSAAFPELLVAAEGQDRDWLAWLSAFAQTHRPFTAYCRVLGGEAALQRFEAQREAPTLGRIEGGCIGLILGEILSSEDVLGRIRDPLPAWSCASTLSFALVRELALYGYSMGRSNLLTRWMQVRGLTRQRERTLDVGSVVDIVSVLEAVEQRRKPAEAYVQIAEVLDDVSNGGRTAARNRFGVLHRFAIDVERDTREERVAKFENVMRTVLQDDDRHGAFILGYMASLINPGTLMHAGLLAPVLLRKYPSVMLWYGVCAGMADPNAILTALGGLGRRALRDVSVPHALLERPRADLYVDELEIYLRERPDDPPEFTVSSPTQLTVELDAGIWTVVNWSRGRQRRVQEETRDNRIDRQWLLREMAPAVGRLAELFNFIREQDAPGREPAPRYWRRDERDTGRDRDREAPSQGSLPLDPPGRPDKKKKR